VIVLEHAPGEGKQRALKRCFERSTGEIVFLTDADCVVDDDCVEATLEPVLLDGEAASTGYWQPFDEDRERSFVAYQWANHLRYQASNLAYARTLDGRNCAIRREALTAAGAFYTKVPTGTDYVLSQQLNAAGYRIRSVLDSRVQTGYPTEISEYLNQGSRWYRNRLVQGYRSRQWRDVVLSLWSAAASLFMLFGPVAWLFRWRAVGFVWLAGLFHLFLSMTRLIGFWRMSGLGRIRNLGDPLKYTGFALISDLSMVKGLLDSFKKSSRSAW
jgi:cellulose synthase/poly-beta-1,6-N-acetylglucosamine synthase-like glycosyltransferase